MVLIHSIGQGNLLIVRAYQLIGSIELTNNSKNLLHKEVF
jgi:hypothetical protein